jgi:hypothetical protein
MRNKEKDQREPRVVVDFCRGSASRWQFAVTQRRGSSSYCVASVSCGWRKVAGGIAANWFPSDNPLALQWLGSKFGMRCLALNMPFVQRLVLIVVVGRCGIGLAHKR